MPKVVVITDSEGRIVGSVRADPIETENGTLQFQMPTGKSAGGTARIQGPQGGELTYQELDVPDELLDSTPDDLHRELALRIK